MLLCLVWPVMMFWGKEADLLVDICQQWCCKKKMLCQTFFLKEKRQNPQNMQLYMDIDRLRLL